MILVDMKFYFYLLMSYSNNCVYIHVYLHVYSTVENSRISLFVPVSKFVFFFL